MNLTKEQWHKILSEGDEDAYSDVMSEFTKDNKNPEVVMICDTFRVLESAVQYAEKLFEVVKKELPKDATFDEYNVTDICSALQLRLEMLIEESLKD